MYISYEHKLKTFFSEILRTYYFYDKCFVKQTCICVGRKCNYPKWVFTCHQMLIELYPNICKINAWKTIFPKHWVVDYQILLLNIEQSENNPSSIMVSPF